MAIDDSRIEIFKKNNITLTDWNNFFTIGDLFCLLTIIVYYLLFALFCFCFCLFKFAFSNLNFYYLFSESLCATPTERGREQTGQGREQTGQGREQTGQGREQTGQGRE